MREGEGEGGGTMGWGGTGNGKRFGREGGGGGGTCKGGCSGCCGLPDSPFHPHPSAHANTHIHVREGASEGDSSAVIESAFNDSAPAGGRGGEE